MLTGTSRDEMITGYPSNFLAFSNENCKIEVQFVFLTDQMLVYQAQNPLLGKGQHVKPEEKAVRRSTSCCRMLDGRSKTTRI